MDPSAFIILKKYCVLYCIRLQLYLCISSLLYISEGGRGSSVGIATRYGLNVTSLNEIPEGFIGKEIPETTYKHYKAVGVLPDCVGKVWGEIWQSGINRKYIADFDVYDEKAQNPQNAEVDVYVS